MEKSFNFNNLPVRVMTDADEQIWFAGIDVCNILEYSNSYQAIMKLDKDERKLDSIIDSQGKKKDTLTINEFGFYSLVLTSTKPEAKTFKKWVCHEVLPAIRKAGKFTSEEEKEHDFEVRQLAKEVFELKKRKAVLSHDLRDIKKALQEKEFNLMLTINADRQQLKFNFGK